MGDVAVYTGHRPELRVRLDGLYKSHTKQSPSQENHEDKDDSSAIDDIGTATMKQDEKVGTIQKGLHHPGRHTERGLQNMAEMNLEISALRQVEKYCGHTPHFPRIISTNNKSMTTTIVGTPIEQNPYAVQSLPFENSFEQVNTIIKCLQKSRVRRLDTLPGMGDCKNMVLSKNRTVGLYDFDISVIDEAPLTPALKILFKRKGPTFEEYANHLRICMMKCLGFVYKIVTGSPAQTSI